MEGESSSCFCCAECGKRMQKDPSGEEKKKKAYFLAVCFFCCRCSPPPPSIFLLPPFPSTPPPLGSCPQQPGHVAIICFCISLIWVAATQAGSRFSLILSFPLGPRLGGRQDQQVILVAAAQQEGGCERRRPLARGAAWPRSILLYN